jgi:hypothetical protein
MDWKVQGNSVIHKSGFTITVDNGSFETPYEVSFKNAQSLGPFKLSRMIRIGLAFGLKHERGSRSVTSPFPSKE